MRNTTKPSKSDIDGGIYGPATLSSEYYPFGRYENLLDDRFIPASMYTWYKSTHEKSKRVSELAKNPEILEVVKKFIGDDILLWGSHFIHQKPGGVHSWHADVEHMNWDGVTVWVGLKNLSPRSSVSVMSYTHELSSTPPSYSDNISIEESSAKVLEAAKELDSRCELKTFCLDVGDFIVWSGRAWHATRNESNLIRHSIILQYCRPNANVRIPMTYSYPNTQWSAVKPPCLPINGNFLEGAALIESSDKTAYVSEVLRAAFVAKGRLMQLAKLIISRHS
jgi:hypothetical protein